MDTARPTEVVQLAYIDLAEADVATLLVAYGELAACLDEEERPERLVAGFLRGRRGLLRRGLLAFTTQRLVAISARGELRWDSREAGLSAVWLQGDATRRYVHAAGKSARSDVTFVASLQTPHIERLEADVHALCAPFLTDVGRRRSSDAQRAVAGVASLEHSGFRVADVMRIVAPSEALLELVPLGTGDWLAFTDRRLINVARRTWSLGRPRFTSIPYEPGLSMGVASSSRISTSLLLEIPERRRPIVLRAAGRSHREAAERALVALRQHRAATRGQW